MIDFLLSLNIAAVKMGVKNSLRCYGKQVR